MITGQPARDIIPALIQWAMARTYIRAMLLTSTRAIPDAPVDALSDYDVILIVEDLHPFVADRMWLNDFGDILVVYWDPVHPDPVFGIAQCSNVTQYVDGLKIDFTLWPVALFQQIVVAPLLPAELDAGYRVLLDKDYLTDTIMTGHSQWVSSGRDSKSASHRISGRKWSRPMPVRVTQTIGKRWHTLSLFRRVAIEVGTYLWYWSLANFIATSGDVERFGKSLYTGSGKKRQCPVCK